MKIIYHGHSCVQIIHNQTSLIIDPYISDNPVAITKVSDIIVQYILITHNHFDHIGNASDLSIQNNASIICTEDLAAYFSEQNLPTQDMHVGGQIDLKHFRVHFVPAVHSTRIITNNQKAYYSGEPIGIVLEIGGLTIYHAGDTALFTDMKWLGEKFDIDLAFLPIGDRYTMGPDDALTAAQWLGAKAVIPIHYNTFPVLKQDPHAFVSSLATKGISGKVLVPGTTFSISPFEAGDVL